VCELEQLENFKVECFLNMCLELIGSSSGCSTKQWVVISLVLLLCALLIAVSLWYCKIRLCTQLFLHDNYITDQALPTPADEAEASPPLLCIDSPNAMRCCEGEYDLIAKDGCNQQPCWLKKDGSRWILSGSDGHWYVARHRGSDSTDLTRAVQLICSQQPHDGVSPHKVPRSWAIRRNFGWRVDPSIAVQASTALFEKEDTILIETEILEIDRKVQLATSCTKSLMCSIGNASGQNGQFLQELIAAPGIGEAGGLYEPGSCDLSTAASSNLDVDMWVSGTGNDERTVSYEISGLRYVAQTVATTPRKMEDCRAHRPGARPADPPAERQVPPRLPPQVLCVVVPSRQTSCSGLYLLVPSEQPNGHPLWRQQAVEPVHWLFCSSSGRWCIGGTDVERECFSRGAGYVAQTCPSGPDVFPHDCDTPWQLWDSDGETFQEDPAIQVTEVTDVDLTSLNPAQPHVSIRTQQLDHVFVADELSFPPQESFSLEATDCQAQSQGLDRDISCENNEVPPVIEIVSQNIPGVLVGEYVLVAAARPNDQPLWHKEDGDMWLYGGMDNRWYIAGSSAKVLRFFCALGEIYHAEEHFGRLPHQMQGCWECCRQGTWVKEPRMFLSASWATRPNEQDILCV